MNNQKLDPDSIKNRLTAAKGVEYWRSLEELADTPEFRQLLHNEYPRLASVLDIPMDRRQFIKVLGASLALAGLSACAGAPLEKIIPYVRQPERIVPDKPLYFATAITLGGYATGVLVENHMGRPTKIEGNPDHPASLGSTDAFAQASILTLYDPDRSQAVTQNGQIRTFEDFVKEFRRVLDTQRANKASGLRIVTETITSPTFADQMRQLLATYPDARWIQYEPATRDHTRAGAQLAFNRYVETTYRLDQADVILSLDSDFLVGEPGSLRYAHDFAARRVVKPDQTSMNRLYVVESAPSLTGAKADHRLGLRAGEIEGLARAVAAGVGVRGIRAGETQVPEKWIRALVRDLQAHHGKSLVAVGESQPPVVHALGHALNATLENTGKTVIYSEPVEANPTDQMGSLRDLAADLDAGKVSVIVVIGANPVYDAPVDLRFGERFTKAGLRVHNGLYQDETAAVCQWHIPQAHYLEAWGDARAYDGTVTIIQPLIAPLYGGKSMYEMLTALGDSPTASGHDIVQAYWKRQAGASSNWDSFWREALNQGVIPNTAAPAVTPSLMAGWDSSVQPAAAPAADSFEVNFRTDPSIYDGRFANNGWLQELPKPLTRLTWDNAVLVSPATARKLGLRYELAGEGGERGAARTDVVELSYQGRTVRAPIWITPGQPDDAVTLHLGYGRTRAGNVGSGIGYNAYLLRTSEAPWFGTGLTMRKTGDTYELASVQQHHMMEGRGLIRSATLRDYVNNPHFAQEGEETEPRSLFPSFKYDGYKWGMSIDTSACIGCNACVVACQSENNIPVVGKDQVLKAREMQWLRIDTYYKGETENPETYFEPVPCMHCENAPCEVVCPVGATVHSSEGLNEMVYNRCVGTRYCSNNCPYKVRRFNFLQYSDWKTESLKPMRNPDVTVRSRGVMEKCTYCVQRIDHARINAEREGRTIRDGEILTACQAACPAEAIVFGNMNDPNSRVAQLKANTRNYGLLTELNTRPRTTFLAAVRNPNPEIEEP